MDKIAVGDGKVTVLSSLVNVFNLAENYKDAKLDDMAYIDPFEIQPWRNLAFVSNGAVFKLDAFKSSIQRALQTLNNMLSRLLRGFKISTVPDPKTLNDNWTDRVSV